MNIEQRRVYVGERPVDYTLVRKRIKNIHLRVDDCARVILSVPMRLPVREADNMVLEHSDFVLKSLKKREEAAKTDNSALAFLDGEGINIFGRRYILRCLIGARGVKTEGDYIIISSPDGRRESYRRLFNEYVKFACEKTFSALLKKYYPYFKKYVGEELPTLALRAMKSAWGTCMPSKKRITLNLRLFTKPLEAVEYVVVHEYCHFIYLNHSRQFYLEVEKIMPDWKSRKNLL